MPYDDITNARIERLRRFRPYVIASDYAALVYREATHFWNVVDKATVDYVTEHYDELIDEVSGLLDNALGWRDFVYRINMWGQPLDSASYRRIRVMHRTYGVYEAIELEAIMANAVLILEEAYKLIELKKAKMFIPFVFSITYTYEGTPGIPSRKIEARFVGVCEDEEYVRHVAVGKARSTLIRFIRHEGYAMVLLREDIMINRKRSPTSNEHWREGVEFKDDEVFSSRTPRFVLQMNIYDDDYGMVRRSSTGRIKDAWWEYSVQDIWKLFS